MKKIADITIEDVEKMNYNELIGLTRETNRTPGGLDTIKEVARLLCLNENDKILDIGTSTGHTSIEFSRLLDCSVVGIDINEMSIETAKERANVLGLSKVRFEKQDAQNMEFQDNVFDVVFAGNVTSLVDDCEKVLNEYWRVAKKNGFLVAVPMYYIETPSIELLENVRNAIRVNIQPYYKEDWYNFFVKDDTEIYEQKDYQFVKCSKQEIDEFCEIILNREHLSELQEDVKLVLREKYIRYINLFNENLSHMGFTILILRQKEDISYNDPQLFKSVRK